MFKLLHTTLVVATLTCVGCGRSADVTMTQTDDAGEPSAITSDGTTATPVIELTDSAVAKFVEYLKDTPDDHIRLSVKREGPSGFMYDLQIEPTPWSDQDFVDQSHGFAIVVSPRDSIYLDGATIDWESRPDGTEGFKFHNPNAIEQ